MELDVRFKKEKNMKPNGRLKNEKNTTRMKNLPA
jgi:hypothetical protein